MPMTLLTEPSSAGHEPDTQRMLFVRSLEFATPVVEPASVARHVVQARILAEEVSNFDRTWLADDEGLERYDKLLKMAERETRAASSLATRLRITRQAIDQQTVARKLVSHSKARKPWELPES